MDPSKTTADKAGDVLRAWVQQGCPDLPDDSELDRALAVIGKFRDLHIPQTQIVQKELGKLLSTVEGDQVPTARYKRLPRIVMKLVRKPHMRLSQMQDLGGCRCVVEDLSEVRKLQELVHACDLWVIKNEDDYNFEPDPVTGYRALHIIVRVDSCLVEIQIRTRQQNAWAQVVEAIDRDKNLNLKDGKGPDELLELFEKVSTHIALREQGLPVDKKLIERIDLLFDNDTVKSIFGS